MKILDGDGDDGDGQLADADDGEGGEVGALVGKEEVPEGEGREVSVPVGDDEKDGEESTKEKEVDCDAASIGSAPLIEDEEEDA